MTALNFILTSEQVVLSMDTLAIDLVKKRPYKMVTKFLTLPHINSIICGTGNFDSIVEWFAYVERSVLCNGVYQLDKITRQVLPDFMDKHNKNNLCTIYQFGLSEVDDRFHGYVYRSTNNFKGEEIVQGLGVKPKDAFLDENLKLDLTSYLSKANSIEEILSDIMHRQKEYDDSQDIENRVGIGGIIQIVSINKGGITIKNYERFDDYKETYIEMLDKL